MVLRAGPHPRDAAGAALYHSDKSESSLMSSFIRAWISRLSCRSSSTLGGEALFGKAAKLHGLLSSCNFSSITLPPLPYHKVVYFAFLHYGSFPNPCCTPTGGHLYNFQEAIEQIGLQWGWNRVNEGGTGALTVPASPCPQQRLSHPPIPVPAPPITLPLGLVTLPLSPASCTSCTSLTS